MYWKIVKRVNLFHQPSSNYRLPSPRLITQYMYSPISISFKENIDRVGITFEISAPLEITLGVMKLCQ